MHRSEPTTRVWPRRAFCQVFCLAFSMAPFLTFSMAPFLIGSPLLAQSPPPRGDDLETAPTPALPPVATAASPWLPDDHWSAGVLWRIHALGLGSHDPAASHRTVATAAADLPDSLAARLSAEWPHRFRAEAALQLTEREGALLPGGFTTDRERIGPMPLRDWAGLGARLYTALAAAPWLAVTFIASAAPGESLRPDHGTAELVAGVLALWGGRRSLGYAPGDGGGLVVNRVERLDGGGLRTATPVPVPLLGSVTAEVLGGPVGANGLVSDPWLLVTRAHARPHPRLDAGFTRAAVFGGFGDASLGVRQIVEVLVGANLGGDFADDQVASVDVRWRPPLRLPLELYGEWAMHDIDFGVLLDMPTYTVGIRLPRLPAIGAGVSLEHTRVSDSCCTNPPWYHHFELAAGWTADGHALGHPLGGHGEQWRLGIGGDAARATVVYDAAFTLRWRGEENVYAPDRRGRSGRLELAADAALGRRASAAIALAGERGDGWRTVEARVVARVRF